MNVFALVILGIMTIAVVAILLAWVTLLVMKERRKAHERRAC